MTTATSSGKIGEVSLSPDTLGDKGAVREMIRAVGGLEAAEENCRVGKSQLARYYDPTKDEHAPLDIVAALEPLGRASPGFPHVTRRLARKLGYALIALPRIGDLSCGDAYKELAAATKEAGDVTTGFLHAIADDGKVSPKEAAALMAEAIEAAESFMRMHALLKQIAEDC